MILNGLRPHKNSSKLCKKSTNKSNFFITITGWIIEPLSFLDPKELSEIFIKTINNFSIYSTKNNQFLWNSKNKTPPKESSTQILNLYPSSIQTQIKNKSQMTQTSIK